MELDGDGSTFLSGKVVPQTFHLEACVPHKYAQSREQNLVLEVLQVVKLLVETTPRHQWVMQRQETDAKCQSLILNIVGLQT